MENNEVLNVSNIVKTYGEQVVLNNVSLHINSGEIYGFVGENGAGKTTLIRVITGLIYPDSGTYSLFGVDYKDSKIHEVRKNVGAIVESPSIVPSYNAYKSLKYQASLLGKKIEDREINDILTFVGLNNDAAKKPSANFSLGMKQRLGIAIALVGDPKFLVLDEPINGLDPVGIVELRNLIIKLKEERGISFLISSHILSELDLVADRFGFISHGSLLKETTKEEIHNECNKKTIISTSNPGVSFDIIKKHIKNEKTYIDASGNVVIEAANLDISSIVTEIAKEGIAITNISSHEGSLEEYYLRIIGGKSQELDKATGDQNA